MAVLSAATITSPSQLSVAGGDTGKEALAHLSRHESLTMIQPLILDLSAKMSRRVALLEPSSRHRAHGPDDLAALA